MPRPVREHQVVGLDNKGYARPERLGSGSANATTFLRGDQTWSSPPNQTGTPASSVVSESGFGQASAVGTATAYARADHSHGTPVNPVTAHEAASDPHAGYQLETEKGAANGYASLDAGTKLPIAQIPTGTTSSSVCLGNDSRLSDARTPLSHGHSIGDTTGLQTALDGKAASTHSHPQSDVTNLVTDLAGKAASVHTHAQSEVTNLVTDLAGKAASIHGHPQSEVTNLVSDLSGKQATLVSGTNIKTVNGTTLLGSGDVAVSSQTSWGGITGTLSSQTDLQNALNGKAASSHTHAIGEIAPPSGGGTTNFLRADGAWAAPVAVAGDPVQSPGSFTVATETQRFAPYRVKLTTTQRITIEGTGRLSCHN